MIRKLKQYVKKSLMPDSFLMTRLADTSQKAILLTFDDGPDPDVTPRVLELLEKYNAKAIFFIPGRRIERAPHVLAEIIKQGHLIGNHTFLHSNGKQPGFVQYWRDVKKCQKMILNECGVAPYFFRPPCGVVSLTTLFAPKLVGLQVMNWSLDVRDWRFKSKQDAIAAADELIDKVKLGDIILLHDDNKHVIHLLQIILPALAREDYVLHSLPTSRG